MAQNNFIVDLIANLNTTLFNRQMRNLQNQRYNVNVGVNNNSLKNTHAQMRQLGTATQNTNSVFGKLKNTISNTFSVSRLSMTGFLAVLNEINKAGRNAKETIKQIDKAITDLSVALNGTREEAAQYVKTLNKQAIELKTTTKNVTDASDAWLRQGKSVKETETLIKDSLVLSKVGKIESADATNYLTSALNGYKLEAEDAISVIDKLTAVDAKSASEAGGLALSMSRTASAADMAGVSMDKLIGYIATVKETTRDSDEAVGNMMKTMLSRMNQVKAGKFIDAETGEALNDMEKVLNKVGIAMRDANGQFISSELVLDELGSKFNEFDSVTQRAIATQLGGAYQYEKVIALLSNYSKALEYAKTSTESNGSAMKKFNESYLGSMEASQAQLQASFESLIMNSDLDKVYSGILEATNALVQFINKANALKGVFTSLAVTGGIKAFLSIKTGVTQAYIALNQFQQALNLVKQPKIATNDFTRLLMLTKNLSASQMKLILSSKSLTLTQKKQLLMNQGLSESEARLKLQNMGLATSYTGLKAATVSVTNACKGLFSTLLANPIFLVATAVSVATMAWQSYKQKIEETRQANMDAATSAKEEADSMNELYIQYSKLSSITDKTSQQEDDFKQVVQDITKALGNKADALENVVIGTDKYAKSLREATKAELQSQYATAKVGAKAAEEALKDKTYSGWDGSQITIAKNEQMTAIKEHVAALEAVQDILAKYEDMSSNGIEWEPVGWDEDRNDMNAVIEYYYDLIEARDRLATDDNADFLMSSDIYKSINTTINSLSESVKNYTEQQYNALKLQYEWQNGIPRTEEEFKAMEESILSASGAGEEFQKILKDFLINDFSSFFPEDTDTEIAKTEQSAKKLFDQLTASKESIDKFTSSVKSAYDSYAKLMNPNVSSSDILSSIQSITSAVSDMDGALDWEFIDGQSNSLELLGNAIEDISREYAESVLSGAGIDIDSKFGQMLANNIIQAQKASIELDNLNDGLDSLQSAYSSLTDIVEAYNETGYLTFDQLQTLLELEPQYLACLIDENGQLQLNEQAMVALANQRLNDAEAQAVQQAITELGTLALQDEQKAVEDNATAFTNAIDDLAGYNQELANTIAEATVGASAIRDLNAAISGAQSQGATDDQINTVLSNLETKLKLIGDVRNKVQSGGLGAVANPTKSKSKSEKDAWLEEYKKKLSMLEDQLDQQLINEKEFYDQSEALLNQYLKDTPAHIEKYAEEISDAEKKLHDNWNSAFDFEKGNLDDKLSDKLITDIEYYKELSKLNNEYYRPTGMLDNGNVISDEQITSVKEYADVLAKLKDSADINAEPEFANAFEKISKVAKESGVSVENLIETYNKFLEGDDRYGNFADEFESNNRDIRDSLRDLYQDLFDNLNKSVDEMQSAFTTIGDAMKEYSEKQALSIDTVQELLSLNPLYLSMLMDENGQLQLNEEAYQKLAKAKLEQMVNDMGLSIAEQILAIETTEQAKALMEAGDANLYMADTSRIAADQAVSDALDIARARSIMQNDSSIYDAAQMLLQSYENAKKLIPMVSFDTQSLRGGSADKEKEEKEDKYSKDFEWIERLLERLSKATEKITKTIEKYINYVKKNNAINRAVKSIDTEVTQNRNAYDFYMSKARAVGLDAATVRKIQNGSISAETITDEGLGGKIDEYMEWYDKAQDVKDAIDDLFEQQRDLISQKLDNILSYYSDMDSYLSSITSKVESLISLNDEMGKRSSLTELVEQFANLNKQIESVTAKGEAVEVVKKQIASGTAESVQKAVADDNAKESERIQSEIDNLDVTQSGTYQKLLKDIEKTQAKIAQYEEKGWDVKKVKQYEKLQKQLENYYAQQEALDNDATSNTVANYSKVYLAWQKLMSNTSYQKLLAKESDGTLKASEQKRLDKYNKQIADYEAQMEKIKNDGQSEIDALLSELSVINGTAEKTTEAQKIQKQISDIEDSLQNTAIYQNLVKNIEDTENKIAALDEIGYDNLTKTQKKTYDKLTATLEDYYAQKESLDEGATASNIAEYNKIYLAWKKLQDKLDLGKNLSTSEWKKYNTYTEQLDNWVNDKATQYEELSSQLQDALNPPDKQGVIKKEYEESSKQMYDSYQNQIDAINDEVKATQNYKNLLANIQKLEQKKDTKGLSKAEEDKLKKYQSELEALEKGGTATNVADYMKTWEAWYKLQQKLDSGKNLSASEASKYDEYRAKLEAWNNEKQTQINDLLSQMEDDLEKLNKTYLENVSEAESEIDEYYANLYNLAKQIAEYNINALEQQLSVIQSMVSYYQNLAGLYETFSGDKLSRLLVDLDEDTALSKLEIYQKELSSLNEQYDVNKNKMKEYQQLLDALDTNDFESSMALFNQVLNDSSVSQATKDNLQQVIDLLNERALSADNWGEYADQWENEWQQALADTKQSLIEVAGSIQEVNDAIRETSFESLTDAITQLGYLKDTLSSITGLINDDWIFDEDGELTEYGNAKVSLLVEQMQTARNEADKYAQQINAIMSMRDTYSSENAYQTALQEAKSNYLSSLNELKGFEDSVVSIMTQSNETIINSLKDVISARIKALKAQKDLYEYNKTITNSQKEIDNIKAQIDALENLTGATDAATKAKLAQLKADLEEKETALQETKDDHTYNLQITALEDFMDTLDQTMSDAADAVNKSFATYKEAIDSALKVYEENKDYLGEWSNTIMKNVLGLANTDGTNTIDVDVQQSGSGESENNIPTIKVENGDTVSAIESSNGTIHGDLIDIKTAIEQGLIVKVDSPLTAINPEMMNFVRNYVPPMTNAVVNTLPQIAERKDVQQPIIQNHYDCLLKVEGSVDKDFAKVLPDYLEKSFKYTADKMYREQVILNGGNRRIRR